MAFALAALTDEIDPGLEPALQTMAQAGIRAAELRTVFGKNILELDGAEARLCAAALAAAGCSVSGLASPIGKSELGRPATYEAERLERALGLAEVLGTRRIRVFSLYPAGDRAAGPEVASRVGAWARRAEAAGVTLLLENEVGLWGDTPERCAQLLQAVSSPALRFAWDPANFLRSGVERPFEAGWHLLQPFVACAHVKDCRADGEHTPAGRGAGQWPELVAALAAGGGVPLVLEPHLQVAGHSTGFTGPERFLEAVAAIRALLPEGAGFNAR